MNREEFDDLVVDARARLLETGEATFTFAGMSTTYTFDAPLPANVWAVLDPTSLVDHMVGWVDDYRRDRGWCS